MTLHSLIPSNFRTLSRKFSSDEPFFSFRRELEKLFDSEWVFNKQNDFLSPSIEVKENDKELILTAELPGVDEKDIDISLSNNILTVRGEKKAEKEEKGDNYYTSERIYGKFSRSFTLPYEVDPEGIKAKFNKGILTLTFSKTKTMQQQTRKIHIKD